MRDVKLLRICISDIILGYWPTEVHHLSVLLGGDGSEASGQFAMTLSFSVPSSSGPAVSALGTSFNLGTCFLVSHEYQPGPLR